MKYVFYITDSGVTAYNNSASSHKNSESFDWNDVALIDAYLSTMPEKSEADVILDLVDEDLYFEWAPKVHPWEKSGIASRRKQRLHQDTVALSEVHWTGTVQTSADGRKEELILSATVTDSFNLSSFLESLEEAQVVLKAIHSKAFLLEDYFRKKVRPYLKLKRQDLNKPFLLVSRQSKNTFRQTFFYGGELRLSRLVEIDKSYDDLESVRQALINETKLAISYVYNQKIVPFNSPIGYVFLDGDQQMLDGILAKCQEEGLIRSTWEEAEYFVGVANFRKVTPNGLNCKREHSPCFSQQASVDFAFSDKPKGFYRNSYVNKINALVTGQKVFIGVNILLFLAGIYYVLITGIDTVVSLQKQAMLEQKIVQHETEKQRLQEVVKLQDDAQQIKASVEFSEAILKLKVNRLISFDVNALSQVFGHHNNIQLSSMDWKTLDRFDSRRNQIDIKAWVYPFYETYHDPVMWVDAFVAELNTIAGIEMVQLQKEPLNRQLSQTLSINSKMGNVDALPFTVTLRVKDAEPK
ncbi:hypothetical protein [Thiomicrorhabdus sp. Kp2]|uniref:hypothetical protein n=1 Tax=Thiomicrorhabdus sp. Kp2 TaxID=1123518 RepID=UPI00041652E5|nr:hypothetical protein [Thiomicrorhabdus sp. Kp2]